LTSEYRQALDQWNQAQQNFDYADPQHIDVAVYQLKLAEITVSTVLKEIKT